MKTTNRLRKPSKQAALAPGKTQGRALHQRGKISNRSRSVDAAEGEGLNPAMRQKILAGAVIAVSRQGTKKLAMGDICDAAGVSRGSLYRYFATKDEVLHAMSDHISASFEAGVVEVAQRHSDPIDILKAVLEFHFSQTRQSARVLEIEPMYVMGFLRGHFERHVAAMKKAMVAVFAYIEREAGMAVNQDLIAQFLIRIELSTLLVPADPLWNRVPALLPAMLQSFIESAKGKRSKPRAVR